MLAMKIIKGSKGFTLIEIIAVLIIIAIVAAVVIERVASSADVNQKAMAEALRSHIRYVQMRAMNADADTSVIPACSASFGISMSGSSYFMFKNCNKTLKVILPGADTADVPLTNMTLAPSPDVTFDKWGRPCLDLNGQTPVSANDINLTLGTEPIRITRNTGYVP
jgi:prepilin-type N-terminal cleavage/methylation domain-containing protein